ncbi:MAG: transposase [Bacillota bacterium]
MPLSGIRVCTAGLLHHFNSRTTSGHTKGVHTKIKCLKRTSYGFRNMEVYVRRLLLAFLPTVSPDPLHTY